MTIPLSFAQEIASLDDMTLDQLREVWRCRWGPPTKLRSAGLLRHLIAWRIQAHELGGLEQNTRRALRSRSATPADGLELGDGAVIRRAWQGHVIEVVVQPTGFQWNGKTWKSLSAIAREATGVRRNGPAFFGLRDDPT
jgi:hypothetical protein